MGSLDAKWLTDVTIVGSATAAPAGIQVWLEDELVGYLDVAVDDAKSEIEIIFTDVVDNLNVFRRLTLKIATRNFNREITSAEQEQEMPINLWPSFVPQYAKFGSRWNIQRDSLIQSATWRAIQVTREELVILFDDRNFMPV